MTSFMLVNSLTPIIIPFSNISSILIVALNTPVIIQSLSWCKATSNNALQDDLRDRYLPSFLPTDYHVRMSFPGQPSLIKVGVTVLGKTKVLDPWNIKQIIAHRRSLGNRSRRPNNPSIITHHDFGIPNPLSWTRNYYTSKLVYLSCLISDCS